MVESDDVLVPASTPRPAKGGLGCLTTVVLFVVVIVIGLIVGTMLSGDDDDGDDERSQVISDGTYEEAGQSATWHVDAELDVEGDTCVFLYKAEEADPVTGSCDDTPQAATLGPTTIVFGLVDSSARNVSVRLSDGSSPVVETFEVEGFDGRFYVNPVSGDVVVEEADPTAGS